MAFWKRIRKSDLSIIDGYESDKKELRTDRFGGPDDKLELVEHIQVPDGLNVNGVKAIDDGGLTLVADPAALDIYEKEENREARAQEIVSQEATTDDTINSLLKFSQGTTQLMLAVNDLFEYLKGLQAAASINTGNMSQPAQDSRQALVEMQTDLLAPIQTARGTRDAAVTGFVLPNPSAGLPADVDDYYSNLP